MNKTELLTYYRSQVVDRERMYAKPLRRYQQKRRLEVVQELASKAWHQQQHDVLLDVGCGDGYGISCILKELSYSQLFGLDLSPQKLRTAHQHLPDSQMILGDAEGLPLADGSFHVVFSLETLEHLLHPQKAVHEIVRVLRPGGTFFLSVPVRSRFNASVAQRLMRFRRRGKFHEHIQFYTLKSILNLLTNAGLEPRDYRFCVFNYPFFELFTRLIPYRIWREIDRFFSRLSRGFAGPKYGLSFGVGSEYLVVEAHKDNTDEHH